MNFAENAVTNSPYTSINKENNQKGSDCYFQTTSAMIFVAGIILSTLYRLLDNSLKCNVLEFTEHI